MREMSFEQAIAPSTDFDASAWRPFLRALDGDAPLP